MPHIIILETAKNMANQLHGLCEALEEGMPYSPSERQTQAQALTAQAEEIADSLDPLNTQMSDLSGEIETFLGI